ncbi:class I SAM-dependent methyltransferase [Qaidamihabitans albus]|uniref:class I SAM-dependent methyltransferase n=1 Tax=Qaidamihabitans albus TaxID=2795733 RepID=UPI0018F14523|nr:class I SAM-dependent methyltransferase [Qaidamihabitans albus]
MTTTPPRYDAVFHAEAGREHTRLAALADTFDPFSHARVADLPLASHPRVLEIGPGLGTLARWMTGTYRPTELVLLGRDQALLDQLRGISTRQFRVDLTAPGLAEMVPADTFDLIHCRFVLMHLPDPQHVLDQVVTWLRPGGCLLVSDGIDLTPASGDADVRVLMRTLWRTARERIGTNPDWARHYPTPLRQAGLTRVGIAADVPILTGGGPCATFLRLTFDELAPDQPDTALGEHPGMRRLHQSDLMTPAPMAMITAWGRRRSPTAHC